MASKIEHNVTHLKRRLRQLSDPQVRRSMERFFKEPVRGLGVRTPDIRRLAGAAAKEYRRASLTLEEILAVADRLWRRGVLEERILALLIVSRFRRQLERRHWEHLDGWVATLSNWGETDGLCVELLAPLLANHPALVKRLKAWTQSASRWRRRAAAVALVPLARRGEQHDAAFQIVGRLASDRDDMVEKAIGWLLKEISRTQPDAVVDYLLANSGRLSRTTMRYACEKLPEKKRRHVLSA